MSKRRGWWIVVIGVVVLAALWFVLSAGEDDGGERPERGQASTSVDPAKQDRRPERETAPPSSGTEQVDSAADAAGRAAADTLARLPFFDRESERAFRWAQVDLDAVRAAMPDNAFWTLGAPTNDPAVLEERAEREARMNDAWGQVLSGNASAADIQAYYAERHRVSSDYVEFADHLLAHYRDVLPESDVGLLEFSSQMHRARLQQMPRKLMEALERKEKQDQLREAWLADEAAFEESLRDDAGLPPETEE